MGSETATIRSEITEVLLPSKLSNVERSQSHLMAVFEQATEALLFMDIMGTVQYANPAFTSLTGYTREEVVGEKTYQVNRHRYELGFPEDAWKAFRAGEAWAGHIHNKRNDGTFYQAVCNLFPIKDEKGITLSFAVLQSDVTRELELERQLRQAQRTEVLGALAGGIAHDFNNILQAILGYCELGTNSAPENELTHKCFKEIAFAGNRAKEQVAQLLAFAMNSEQEHVPLDLHTIVVDTLKFLRGLLPSTIEMKSAIVRCGRVKADPVQIRQVIMTLCTDAYLSVRHSGGRLTVSLDEVTVDADLASTVSGLREGGYARLIFQHAGHDARVTANHAAPCSDRPHTSGTSHLSVIQEIMKTHDGAFTGERTTKPQEGAAFSVYLPILPAQESTTRSIDESSEEGASRILLVDDEQIVVESVSASLRKLGYEVTGATNSLEAVRLFQARPSAFDAVVTDQTMPDLTGTDLAQEILHIRPEVPIVLCTGLDESVSKDKLKETGIRELVAKPIRTMQLVNAIRRAITA